MKHFWAQLPDSIKGLGSVTAVVVWSLFVVFIPFIIVWAFKALNWLLFGWP